MTRMSTRSALRRVELRLVLTHPDGRTEDLGVVSAYYRNPLRRLQFRWGLIGRALWRHVKGQDHG